MKNKERERGRKDVEDVKMGFIFNFLLLSRVQREYE